MIGTYDNYGDLLYLAKAMFYAQANELGMVVDWDKCNDSIWLSRAYDVATRYNKFEDESSY